MPLTITVKGGKKKKVSFQQGVKEVQARQGYSKETAQKVMGKIQAIQEGTWKGGAGKKMAGKNKKPRKK